MHDCQHAVPPLQAAACPQSCLPFTIFCPQPLISHDKYVRAVMPCAVTCLSKTTICVCGSMCQFAETFLCQCNIQAPLTWCQGDDMHELQLVRKLWENSLVRLQPPQHERSGCLVEQLQDIAGKCIHAFICFLHRALKSIGKLLFGTQEPRIHELEQGVQLRESVLHRSPGQCDAHTDAGCGLGDPSDSAGGATAEVLDSLALVQHDAREVQRAPDGQFFLILLECSIRGQNDIGTSGVASISNSYLGAEGTLRAVVHAPLQTGSPPSQLILPSAQD
mmetsp:Transcript_118479/g.330520  ORF Transcript_118479/g.330520 Transcript_118479/m.330520 type:complete len:277 (-) Transcript_118479:1785-2615(-)